MSPSGSTVVVLFGLLAAYCDAATMRGGAIRTLQAKSDVPCSQAVRYKVVNDCQWNAERQPTDYPSNAHWSPLCGTTHDSEASLYTLGGTATDGVKLVAETGDCSILEEEVAFCSEGGNCGAFLKFPCDPFSGTCISEGMVDVSEAMPYLSMISMVAPSPDWIVGVDSFGLCKDGVWVAEYEKDLFPLDAGTDGGETFASDDVPLAERVPIVMLVAEEESNEFYNPMSNMIYPLCKISMTLQTS
ncbi:hypothetical protein BSKO_01805 [Bryopsis sp. KO-2023]|nr:hypothetical protein BSKO_01805 [Bryopsis sp. KO-2023]